MGPDRTGPPAHFHRSISESFFVLLGTVRVFDGEQWLDLGVGDFAHVPPGGVHAFENASGEPASMLLHFSPGSPPRGLLRGPAAGRLDDAGRGHRVLRGARQPLAVTGVPSAP
jgi:mannose-6-phosphate isomerase-like protein (cupin superfamily)